MAFSQPIISLLRPLGPSRPSTYRQFFRFSTAIRLPADVQARSSASTNPPVPPSSTVETIPQSFETSEVKTAEAQFEADSAQVPDTPIPIPLAEEQTPKPRREKTPKPLAYHVARSKRNNLPIYVDYKRGGNLHLTKVQKISGNFHVLKDQLRFHLKKKGADVMVNKLNGHVIVKGDHKKEVAEFLKNKGF